MGKPVWGVGPLLPEQFYKLVGSVFHDRETRTNQQSSKMTGDEIVYVGKICSLKAYVFI